MALAIFPSHPERILNVENRMASQTEALLTSFPTIMRCSSIRALADLRDWLKMETPNLQLVAQKTVCVPTYPLPLTCILPGIKTLLAIAQRKFMFLG